MRGRPRKYETARPVLSIRLRQEVREVIAARAEAGGRSLSEQVEHMLEAALAAETIEAQVAALRAEVQALASRIDGERNGFEERRARLRRGLAGPSSSFGSRSAP